MASTSDWFESIAEAERLARKRLPSSVFSAVRAGAEAGVTLDDNVAAFSEIGLLPRIATGVGAVRDTSTSVMGQPISLPVVISPTGAQAIHPEGEVAVARASATARTGIGLSSFATSPVESVVAANPVTFFQIYWLGDRGRMEQLMSRARQAGAKALILTLDWTFSHRRDWGSPAIPERIDLSTMVSLGPQVLRRPRWLYRFARAGGPPSLAVPNMAAPGEPAPGFFAAYSIWMGAGQPGWDDLAWLRETWGGPFMLKGVSHPEDARHAVEIGADAISVSNHGGNNLDTTPAAIRTLPAVVEAVGGEIEILLDGGVRRGGDVVKALALGARAVMIGRPYLWGLAARGETGVSNVLEILRAGVEETLLGLGRESIHELSSEDVLLPEGFVRRPASPYVAGATGPVPGTSALG